MIEEWKILKSPNDTYKGPKNLWEVSNYGRVRVNGIIHELRISNSGYYCTGHYLIHRLVAELFIGEIPKGYCIDHIDGNKLNNRVDNLRICTYSDNIHSPISYNRMLLSRNTEEYKNNQKETHLGVLKGKHWKYDSDKQKRVYY